MAYRILIADDHPTIRRVLRGIIESHAGWEVCAEVENGFEAMGKAKELKPDLIILDLAMPVMDGIRAAREISSAVPGLPILMHTMYGSAAVNLEAKKAGVSRVVAKGQSGDDLIGAIGELLKEGQARTTAETSSLRMEKTTAAGAAESTTPATEKPSEASAPPPEHKNLPEPN